MHRMIEDGLEDYLAGRVLREFEVHLEFCVECREELEGIRSVSVLMREVFDSPAVSDVGQAVPAPGFYARLTETIESRRPVSPWSFFSIDAVFGRRVAFASLLALALVGGFLISHETNATILDAQPSAESVIAEHDPSAHDATVDRNRMMVALTNYQP